MIIKFSPKDTILKRIKGTPDNLRENKQGRSLLSRSVRVLPPHIPVHLSFSELSTRSIMNPGTWKPSPQNPCSSTPHTTQASRGIWVTRRPQPSGTMRQWPLTGTGHIPGSPRNKVTSIRTPRTQRPCHRQPPWTPHLRGMNYEVSTGFTTLWFF